MAKLAGEHYMSAFTRVYGLETVTLRYFNVFGPFQDPTSHYSGVLAIFCRKCSLGSSPQSTAMASRAATSLTSRMWFAANLLAADAPAEKVSGKMMNVATGAAVTLNQSSKSCANSPATAAIRPMRNPAPATSIILWPTSRRA